MSTAPQVPPAGTPKKTSPWIFVLIGCAGIIVISGIVVAALVWFGVNKAREAGLDPELMREQPALAMAKIMAAANPDIEVVDVDEGAGRITFRDKKTGKTVTMNAEDLKEGRISFESDEGEVMSFEASGEGEEGRVRMETSEGTFEYGATSGGDLPGWIARYPGSEPKGVMRASTPDGVTASFGFTTSDSVQQVVDFYKKNLEDAGLTVNTMIAGGANSGGTVSGENADGTRNAIVIVGRGSEGTTVSLTCTEK